MRRQTMIAPLTLILLAGTVSAVAKETLAPAPGPRHALVSDGQISAALVLPQNPDALETYAAKEFQKYVKAITGKALPIFHEPQHPTGYGIWLGQTKAAQSAKFTLSEEKLGRDGYAAQANQKGLIVVGRCPIGTLFGTYDIIEREFGVRWFVPDEKRQILTPDRQIVWVGPEKIGEVVPKSQSATVGTFRREFKPSFDFRWIREGNWSLRNRMNVRVQVNGQTVGVNWKWHFHTFEILIPPAKYFKEHPEWFALVRGKRQGKTRPLGHSSQLCTSNPEVVQKLVEGILETLRADPTIEVITLSPNDGGGGFCQCDVCKAQDGTPLGNGGEYSNRLAIMNNEIARRVAKHFPNVLIKIGAYGYYRLPPQIEGFQFEPNLLIQLARNSNQPASAYNNVLLVEPWVARVGKDRLSIYAYYALASFGKHRILRPTVHAMRDEIPWYRDLGLKGFYTQYMQQPWYQVPLNHYIAAKLAWNADLDVDWLIDDYCEKFFEEAAEPMRDYLLGLEQAMIRYKKNNPNGHMLHDKYYSAKVYDKPTRDTLRSFLDQAKELAHREVVRRRVAKVRLGFDECEQNMVFEEKK